MDRKDMYFRKDKLAEIYHLTHEGTDPYGVTDRYYESISPSPLWCYSSQLSMEKTYLAMALDTKETRYFVFNNQGDLVAPLDYVLYRNKWYRITRIDTRDDYNTDMFIYVEDADEPRHAGYHQTPTPRT